MTTDLWSQGNKSAIVGRYDATDLVIFESESRCTFHGNLIIGITHDDDGIIVTGK